MILEEGSWAPGVCHRERKEVTIWRTQDDPLSSIACLLAFTATAGAQELGPASRNGRDWRGEMVRVHARFHGRPGTFAHFGDSITETLAFWTPLKHARKDAPPEMEHAFRRVEAYMRPECWRDWKGPEFGNQGGRTIRWAEENVGALAGAAQPGGSPGHVRYERPTAT